MHSRAQRRNNSRGGRGSGTEKRSGWSEIRSGIVRTGEAQRITTRGHRNPRRTSFSRTELSPLNAKQTSSVRLTRRTTNHRAPAPPRGMRRELIAAQPPPRRLRCASSDRIKVRRTTGERVFLRIESTGERSRRAGRSSVFTLTDGIFGSRMRLFIISKSRADAPRRRKSARECRVARACGATPLARQAAWSMTRSAIFGSSASLFPWRVF